MFIKKGLQDHFNKIEYRDNKAILESMWKYPTGIFYQLNNHEFIRKNYKYIAKDVEYNIISFCTKNLDELNLNERFNIINRR